MVGATDITYHWKWSIMVRQTRDFGKIAFKVQKGNLYIFRKKYSWIKTI